MPFLPIDDLMLNQSLSLFTKVSVILSGLVAFVFVMRLVFLQARISAPSEYGGLFLDIVEYFGMTALFPMLIRLLMHSIASLSQKISYVETSGVQKTMESFLSELLGDSVFFEILGKIGDIAIQIFVQSVYSVLISLLLGIAPVLIFTSSILKVSQGLQLYFQSLLALALWPVLWNVLGSLGRGLWPHFNASPIRTVIFWGVIQILQVLSPIFCILLFRSVSSSGAVGSALGRVKDLW